ncbi:hypothetical protein BV22DRAFT_1013332 [Leucogyrophana mollusca]|uniref:Uncharacterized protein n=1 Tax=Leucogyrophana mollusca TaxID=85980 RepID=A0ACB8BF78_9AGAM|nr:hypothetical protein BV22DRAFT_1013332 [Leucogyrophana mollusca]
MSATDRSQEDLSLNYIINHVFCPLKLPQKDDHSTYNDLALASMTLDIATKFWEKLGSDEGSNWEHTVRMLTNLCDTMEYQSLSPTMVESQLEAMESGGVLAFLIRAQNAGLIVRRFDDETTFESFEVSPASAAVMGTVGKLLCSYPGPAIAVPHEVVDDPKFRAELANFLYHMNEDILDSAASTTKAGSTVIEERDTAHPRYITQLLTGILRGLGRVAEVPRIRKRINDDVCGNDARLPWRRSSLWLLVRVALQTTLEREVDGRGLYKAFMAYLMATITQRAVERDLPNDILHFTSAKISRRLFKLGSSAPTFVSDIVVCATREVKRKLEEQWQCVQDAQAAPPHWNVRELDVVQDTFLSLLDSRGYLRGVLTDRHGPSPQAPFQPHEHPRQRSIGDFLSSDQNYLVEVNDAEVFTALIDFERAVQDGLSNLVSLLIRIGLSQDEASRWCRTIESRMMEYSTRARQLYKDNPENYSIMLLTLLELWVAVDRLVMEEIPLLAEYSPEVPVEFPEPLILHKAEQLARLQDIQLYLTKRHCRATPGQSVFSDGTDHNVFSIRFFDRSPELQSLKDVIEVDAEAKREAKVEELRQMNARHAKLSAKAKSLDHRYFITYRGYERHDKNCEKCLLQNQLSKMRIDVHEWPLPKSLPQAKTVVFELAIPATFNVWRSITFYLLVDIGTPNSRCSNPVDPHTTLLEYIALAKYRVCHDRQRVTLASTRFCAQSTAIPGNQSKVCVNNGLEFRLYDRNSRTWATKSFAHCNIYPDCTFMLPVGRYRALQDYVSGTSHTSNHIISTQATCHPELSLHEFIAFGNLRSGPLLQWLNITRELRAKTLSFREEEVHSLLLQAAWQVGPLGNGNRRLWHDDLKDVAFGEVILDELRALLLSVESNWVEMVSMRTIIALTRRLLTSAEDMGVIQGAYDLLHTARSKTFNWLVELSRSLEDASGAGENESELRGIVRDMAATCRSTYDVEPIHIESLLHSSLDIQIFAQCAIIIHDNTPPYLDAIPITSKLLLERDRRMAHELEPWVRSRIRACRQGLDEAVKSIWPGYRPGTAWRREEGPDSRWLTSSTASEGDKNTQSIHFNILDGRLLVNGKPVGKLPVGIVRHPTYSQIFGNKVLDVVPGDLPGMDYATRGRVCHYQVYFCLRQGDLIIRATRGHESLEVIPREKLGSDLPKPFVEGHVHWLDSAAREIEIRPVESMWNPSSNNWRISFSDTLVSTMGRGEATLVDVRSRTFKMISGRLQSIEAEGGLVVTRMSGISEFSLTVNIPRFKLSFFVNHEGELQSHDFGDMVVDTNQSTGVMFGLRNQLVLRPKNAAPDRQLLPRQVLIPQGDISWLPQGYHVSVHIETHSHHPASYHLYRIDSDLGCLSGNISMASQLYKAYLHALTGSCMPDPLTGRTGTEEALSCLRSASCLSFMRLEKGDVDLLRQIASLTVSRAFYPSHLRSMQQVEWQCLTPAAQHHGFHAAAMSILEHADRLQLFHEKSESRTLLVVRDSHLMARSSLRGMLLYPEEFAGPLPRDREDTEYVSRDILDLHDATEGEARAHDIAIMVHQWPSRLQTSPRLLDILKTLRSLEGMHERVTLQYSCDWLKSSLKSIWISAYNRCRMASKDNHRYQLAFTLSAVGYDSPGIETTTLVSDLLAVATIPRFRNFPPPGFPSYTLSDGFNPDEDILRQHISSYIKPFEETPEASLVARPGESEIGLKQRRSSAYEERCKFVKRSIVEDLLQAWPCEQPQLPSKLNSSNFANVTELKDELTKLFGSCYRNSMLREHIRRVQAVLDEVRLSQPPANGSRYTFPTSRTTTSSPPATISSDQLFRRAVPTIAAIMPLSGSLSFTGTGSSSVTEELQSLIRQFQNSGSSEFCRIYGSDLDKSMKCLANEKAEAIVGLIPFVDEIWRHYQRWKTRFSEVVRDISQSLLPSNPAEEALCNSGQWPRSSVKFLLGSLASVSKTTLGPGWRSTLISLAETTLQLQRSRRLLLFALSQSFEDFFKEMKNTGCKGWDAKTYPDWLLIQIENNFLVRPTQASVAHEMISPKSGHNTTLQLNMGEGKSSVIVPIAASALADGKRLVRIIVLKSLAPQMVQLLAERLSGLTNRRIFYMPFARSTSLDPGDAEIIHDLMEECAREHGVWVVQPDHILSYKLMSVRQILASDAKPSIAEMLLKSQKWLELHARDILDESDEILHVRYQLVYTEGLQRPLTGFPYRWTTTQQILTLVKGLALRLRNDFPLGVDIKESSSERFPQIRILQADAGKALVCRIATSVIMDSVLPNHNFGQFPTFAQQAALEFITTAEVSPEDVRVVEGYYRNGAIWSGLLLLRGLLACGILVYALKERRWRVNYGMDLRRTMLAVPYRAKDAPALRAEFGHPDVAVILTCLSYYYGGLEEEQLMQCFQLLVKDDNPNLEYEMWVSGCDNIPETLRQLSGVNVKSTEQRTEFLIPLFRYNQVVINFFLSRVVFPKEAKEFPQKLACSGWDLAEQKREVSNVVTGFSGTNDNRYLLPTSITQRDPEHQLSTNARVLAYLLRPENNYYLCTADPTGKQLSTDDFLRCLGEQTPEIRILLDVGAQMLELQNKELVGRWLALKPSAQAAIYFNEHDQLTVLSKDGNVELFVSSQFAHRLGQCLFYLDDAHTRGTDIKLPLGSRAAVTLGPKVTKDRLAQGCMRMRKLGHGHSVMFFAPLEVDRAIRLASSKSYLQRVESVDILRWTMLETCTDIQHRVSHWAQQGTDHHIRHAAWSDFSSGRADTAELENAWLQKEALTLDEMYKPGGDGPHRNVILPPEIQERCTQLGVTSLSNTQMDEEQEREIVHEVERENKVQRPPPMPPAAHEVDPQVRDFIRNGEIPIGSTTFRPAFRTLGSTSASFPEHNAWSQELLVTRDFLTTVQCKSEGKYDDYLRPVNWILSSPAGSRPPRHLVVLSPFEVNTLLQDIRRSKHVHLHIYAPRVTQAMRSCDNLRLHSIPPLPEPWSPPELLIPQLNLFAGQLYLNNYQTYVQLCRFLGVYARDIEREDEMVGPNGFIAPERRPQAAAMSPFQESPVPPLKELIAMRRKGMEFLRTHLGGVLQGRLLGPEDFEA